MVEVIASSSKEKMLKIGMKIAWGVVAVTSLYAVLAPMALFDLTREFWGILLFFSVVSLLVGEARSYACAFIWGIVSLALSILYIISLRDYQTAGGEPIRDISSLQTTFILTVSFAGAITLGIAFGNRVYERDHARTKS